jgi:hypothetical protein
MSYAPATLEWTYATIDDSLAFALHPLGPPVVFDFGRGGVTVRAETLALGPGYDAHVRDVALAIARELDLVPGRATVEDDEAEARSLAFLAREASRATPGSGPHRIGDFEHHRYPEVALATLLGPRDEAWRARVAADPREGRDAFPWFRDGAEHLRGRALSLLWHQTRFRPSISEAEDDLAESVLEDLRAAHREDPNLDYPAEAWAELSSMLGGLHPPPRDVLVRDANRAPPGIRGRIGYRRMTVERGVGGGFSIRFPGELAEDEREDGIWAYDLSRRIHVAGILADPDAPAEVLVHEAVPDGEPLPLSLPGLETRAAILTVGDETELTAIAATKGAFCVLTAAERGGGSSFVRDVAASLTHRA